MSGQKHNLSCRFKLEPIKPYYICFVIKMLRKYYGRSFYKKIRKKYKKKGVFYLQTNMNHIK